jgi:hypothetical protein
LDNGGRVVNSIGSIIIALVNFGFIIVAFLNNTGRVVKGGTALRTLMNI